MNTKLIKEIKIYGKYCEIIFEDDTKISEKYGNFYQLIEDSNLYEYVINNGCKDLLLDYKEDRVIKLHYSPKLQLRIK